MSRISTDVEAAVAVLARGGLVAFPTETVYGLGADASSSTAVGRVFAAKGRPAGHPLIVHLAGVEHVPAWADLDEPTAARVQRLAKAFWPGPLTMILPRTDRVAPEAVGGRATVGLRVPDHPVALALLAAFAGGVAGPSANRFGKVSPTTAAHVLDDLGDRVDLVLDGGPTRVGVESTIIELVGPKPTLLRPGGVDLGSLARALGEPVLDGRTGESRASGMLRSHYAPDAAVELVDREALAARLGALDTAAATGSSPPLVGVIAPFPVEIEPSWTLPADASGYAGGLYAALRAADAAGVERLLVVPPADGALLDAVLDRLAKAAATRP